MAVVCICLYIWKESAEHKANWGPDYPKVNLEKILQKEELSSEDYSLIFYQTGLGKQGVDYLLENDIERIYDIQRYFFHKPEIVCERNSIISWQEGVVRDNDYICEFTGLETGDILISPCSHAYGWRNGHAAIVVDGEAGIILESAVMGMDSAVNSINVWKSFPAFMVLRAVSLTMEEREAIAAYAMEHLNGVPYGFVGDIISDNLDVDVISSTHCAHLVWSAYMQFGYDLDSDGGIVVTPRDIANSLLLEVVQIYGINPDTLWRE